MACLCRRVNSGSDPLPEFSQWSSMSLFLHRFKATHYTDMGAWRQKGMRLPACPCDTCRRTVKTKMKEAGLKSWVEMVYLWKLKGTLQIARSLILYQRKDGQWQSWWIGLEAHYFIKSAKKLLQNYYWQSQQSKAVMSVGFASECNALYPIKATMLVLLY